MSKRTTQQARAAVKAILDDLTDRRGLGQEWEQIDDDIQAEIRAAWVAILVQHFGAL